MRLSDIMSNAGLSTYAEIAMVLFMVAFLAILVWVFRPGRGAAMDAAAHLPLDDDRPLTPGTGDRA